MLKIALIPEEERGSRQLAWWAGSGTARVLEIEGPAVLLDRASGSLSLAEMSRDGRDSEATSIIVKVATLLHRPSQAPLPELMPLQEWFRPLFHAANATGGALLEAARVAERLLASAYEAIPLHGDLHHWNLLDFGGEWRAIDPKGLLGERTFDLIHLLRNPDCATALAPARLGVRVEQIARESTVDKVRLLGWAVAFAGLSAAWLIEDGEYPEADLALLSTAGPMIGLDL